MGLALLLPYGLLPSKAFGFSFVPVTLNKIVPESLALEQQGWKEGRKQDWSLMVLKKGQGTETGTAA